MRRVLMVTFEFLIHGNYTVIYNVFMCSTDFIELSWSKNNKIYGGHGQWRRTFACELLMRVIQFRTSRFVFVVAELHFPLPVFECDED